MGTLATKSVQNVLVIEKPGLGVVTSRSSSLVLPLRSARKLLELIAQNFFCCKFLPTMHLIKQNFDSRFET